MALIIEPKGEKKINVPGVDIELQSVYVRIRFGADYSGRSIEVETITFKDKSKFTANDACFTNVPMGNLGVHQLTENETEQSTSVAHRIAKDFYEQQGFKVTIDLDIHGIN